MKKLKLKLIAITVATMTVATLPSVSASAAWMQNEGNWNYLSDLGEMKTGWVNDNGAWYYLDNSGGMKTGWVNDNGAWYYLDNSGRMKTCWINDNGAWYYANNSGEMKKEWVNDNGTWYYLDNSGAMKTGWINDNGVWYFANASGVMQTGIVQVDGKTYSLDVATGAMQVGNVTINGNVYTFAQSGEAIGKDVVPSKIFNSNGVQLTATNTSGNDTNASDASNTSASSQQNSSSSSSSHHSNNSSKVSKVGLTDAITAAKTKYTAAVEGTENGQYKVGAKATFKIAIDAAQTVVDNTGSMQKDIDSAVTALASATTIFDNSINKDVNSSVATNYLENYREQYHYSPAKAWTNDPNGMVYFDGEYHLFYQYNPDASVWGPMHWGHAVSKDLIHWTELPIALTPDDGGTIYSGSAVVDKDNTSGFFDGIEGGGLVAIYTQDYKDENGNEKQKQSIAYSTDNGRTWTKYAGNPVIAADADPLNNSAFRDPKVFYNEEAGKWFMAVAGGPLRFFSSDNLKDWKPEGMDSSITTECPDFYKLEVGDTGTYKWVLSEGGRYYRVGDFKQVDGVWKFISDSDDHLPMNFAKDAYAAQTYYGTGENGTPDGRRIMINWMNNWDYCNNVAPITKTFNGSFDLQTELKLVNTDAGIRLIQQPIDEYKTLRKSPTIFNNVTISPDQPNIMSGLSGSQYEIVAEFTPDASTTEVGFKLRVGKSADQETIVKYNTQTEEVTLDRSKSGKSPSADKFLQAYSQKMGKTSDGKIQLHIFVDAASVEVYGNNGEVTGSAQIFSNRSSDGVEVYSVGGNSTATIQYYPLSGIWNNEVAGKESALVSLSEGDLGKKVGDEFTIYTATVPETAEQGVTWKFDSNILEIVNQDDKKTTFKTKGVGNTNLTATSKDQKSSKTINVSVYDSNPSSIIKDLTNFETTGDWYVKDNSYTGSSSDDGFAVAQETNVSGKVSTLKADADVSDGSTAGLVLLSKSANPKEGSIIANINKNGEYRVFVFTGIDDSGNATIADLNSGIVPKTDDNIYKLRAEVGDGHIKYWINDELVCDTKQRYYETGRFGLNVYGGATSFKNVNLSNDVLSTETSISGSGLTFDNTPKDLHVSDDSYVVDGGKNNNGFAISDQNIDTGQGTYTLDVDSKMLGDWHNQNPANGDVAGVVLFAQGDNYFGDGGIIANVGKWGHYKLFGQVPDGNGGMKEVTFAEGDVPEAQYNRYHLKVELNGNHIIYWINNKKVCDITQDYYTTGKFGLNVWNGASEFRNITLTSDAAVTATAPVKEEVPVSKVADTIEGDITVTTGAAVTVAEPVTGEVPVSTIADTTEYTATITWSEAPVIFESNKVYTAKITIRPKAGYTLIGVPKDFFTVEGATSVTNDANSGVITAVFPATN
ncbi:glycoside hydrolase family 32 protein [Clostridium saccharobutylicum]|uniref:Fructan beta-fructosidase FruA n=4 Tax=Clostridium saccharobutylicum TaxID=169679 RepID=U5MTR7_CLOSA|nr:glycoside hydrolase family 32 protein [Clostridium saccharobutylicum]AGX43051.1 fructan beta-fructosidase FruA [Clostridium saccharobutylicum DSM 13864]AQR90342.1 fructan beta-fructosidase precursor [Clostridium saccharobutylicum]AQS00248.1 fructan beta-fructosidase precursor [Clostridium saccharobutylicum]AQS14231.1 fructan beta-fructosidase precursor [Clostridium saccharobutylicum]MBA2907613.1 fructan beta-fructosidase [Clostridium saccharobutylicum]